MSENSVVDRQERARRYCVYIGGLVAFALLVASFSVPDAYRLLLTILQEQGASDVKTSVAKFAFWFGFARAWGEVLKAIAEFRRKGPPWQRLGPRAFDATQIDRLNPVAYYITQRANALLDSHGADRRRALVSLCDSALTFGFSVWLVFEAFTCQACQQAVAVGNSSVCSRLIVVASVGVGAISGSIMLRARMQF